VADYWELVCASPAGGVDSVVNEKSSVDAQLDQRHLMLRGDTVSQGRGGWRGRRGGREGGGEGGRDGEIWEWKEEGGGEGRGMEKSGNEGGEL
jgi:hypothetical protein